MRLAPRAFFRRFRRAASPSSSSSARARMSIAWARGRARLTDIQLLTIAFLTGSIPRHPAPAAAPLCGGRALLMQSGAPHHSDILHLLSAKIIGVSPNRKREQQGFQHADTAHRCSMRTPACGALNAPPTVILRPCSGPRWPLDSMHTARSGKATALLSMRPGLSVGRPDIASSVTLMTTDSVRAHHRPSPAARIPRRCRLARPPGGRPRRRPHLAFLGFGSSIGF